MKGFTLIEAVLAVGVFALLAVTGALLLFSTLRGAKKAAAAIEVRSQGANAMGVMTQLLRYATQVTSCSSSQITFTASDGSQGNFSCVGDDYLAYGSGRLTSTKVKIVSCVNVFDCSGDNQVKINFSLQTNINPTFTDESSRINFESQVELRNR